MRIGSGLWNVIKREVRLLTSRPIYLVGMTVIPICMALFFVSLLSEGLPTKVPAAVVDLDHTQTSRQMTRSLKAMELVDIRGDLDSYNKAMDAVQRGEIYGFFLIPDNFERDAVGGRGTKLTFYSNLTFYVPGTLVFKGFKTMGVTTSGRIVQTSLSSKGVPDGLSGVLLQPMTINNHPLKNPWLNYSYYLSTSFLPGVLQLMIFLMTAYAFCHEIKTGGTRQWLAAGNGDIWTAIIGKLAPQTLVFTVMGLGMNALMFHYLHFPQNCPTWHMTLGMVLFVIACQSFAVFICEVMPNLRLALSLCSLTGILAFSVAAFSFPVQAMYGGIAIFSYILPVRWYFLIYIDQALNGMALYFSRYYYAVLLIFPILAMLCAPLLRKTAKNPVYVP
ncbi:MAG: ABC transporter permease [Muribaculaceae bacterium]|nr:ABC transporter permease [Muribaculaceae bacterium]